MSYSSHFRRFAEKLGMIPTKEEKEMKAIKEWKVGLVAYNPDKGICTSLHYTTIVRAQKKSQVRRLVLDVIYRRGLFVRKFVKVERKSQ